MGRQLLNPRDHGWEIPVMTAPLPRNQNEGFFGRGDCVDLAIPPELRGLPINRYQTTHLVALR
jgi:hypothetical protein